ncbi:MAG: NAD(P)/FAD-dependent oxidoreductase, partial [Acidobacteria bacterium]|nr:NAD(P)/FAD-dependent oxidoreductase [Acidobacteriota bacterium]
FRLFRVKRPLAVETLVEAREHGWWYAVPVPGDRVAAGWMTDPDLLRDAGLHQDAAWMEQLRASHHIADVLDGAEPLSAVEVRSAGSFCLQTITGPGWLAAGDSASTYDPLSGQGILKALRFGRIASYAVLDSLRGRPGALALYERLVRQDYETYLEQKKEYYGRVKRWPESMFWRRRQG